eukprot:COSAG01_NODE_33781_length_558_cov_4.250545_1_plen_106_part_10
MFIHVLGHQTSNFKPQLQTSNPNFKLQTSTSNFKPFHDNMLLLCVTPWYFRRYHISMSMGPSNNVHPCVGTSNFKLQTPTSNFKPQLQTSNLNFKLQTRHTATHSY